MIKTHYLLTFLLSAALLAAKANASSDLTDLIISDRTTQQTALSNSKIALRALASEMLLSPVVYTDTNYDPSVIKSKCIALAQACITANPDYDAALKAQAANALNLTLTSKLEQQKLTLASLPTVDSINELAGISARNIGYYQTETASIKTEIPLLQQQINALKAQLKL
ncbi:MAG: hypothetical protein NT128_00320 [Proteobacteria bacterium]|nr:hypothetical protein [Pseudomonadota bacterium]